MILEVGEMWDQLDARTYCTVAYFRDDVIILRFYFSQGSGILPVVKPRVWVKIKLVAWLLRQKTVFPCSKKKIRQNIFEILGSLHSVLR